MPCPHCRADVAPTDVYCISCGARLGSDAVTVSGTAGSQARVESPPTASASMQVPRSGRGLVILFTLLINLGLLAASAWLVYSALSHYAERNRPSMSLGAPRLVRVVPRSTPAPDAGPAEPSPQPSPTPAPVKKAGAAKVRPPSPSPAKAQPAAPAKKGSSLAKVAPAAPAKKGSSPAKVAPAAPGSRAGSAPPPTSRPASSAAPKPEEGTTVDDVRAGLDAESVRMVVQHHLPQVRACYDRALKQQPELAGIVEVKFEVSGEGRARNVTVFQNTTGHDGLGKCLAGLLRTWRFPKPVGGDVEFIYPFHFSSGD